MKKLITLILALICALLISTQGTINIKAQDEIDGLESNLEAEANASIINETLDFVNNPTKAINTINKNKVKGAKDSTWNANNNTLTLKGVNLMSTAQNVILLPAGSTISVENFNTIRGVNIGNIDCTVIKVEEAGDLNISKLNKNVSSVLMINALNNNNNKTKGISVNGNLNINDGCFVVIRSTNGCIYCNGNLTIGNTYISAANANENVECFYVTGKLKNTSEYTYLMFGQDNMQTEPNKSALYAGDFETYSDDTSATTNLHGRSFSQADGELEFKDHTLKLKTGGSAAVYVSLNYIAKYTLQLKAENGVEVYKGDVKLDQSKWPYYFYKKGNDNVIYLNMQAFFYTTASTAVHIGKGVKLSGNNEGSSLYIHQENNSTDKYGLIADGSLVIKDLLAIYLNMSNDTTPAETNNTGIKAESIQVSSNCRLTAQVGGHSLANAIETKSIKLTNSELSAYIYVENTTTGAALLINNPDSTKPIEMIGDSYIETLAHSSKTGSPEALFIKTDKTINEAEGTFASDYDESIPAYKDLVWKPTQGGYHYEEENTSNGNITAIVFRKPSPTQVISGDMSYSNNAFHGNFVVKQAGNLVARLGGTTHDFDPTKSTLVNKTTSETLNFGQQYSCTLSPSLGFVLNKDYLNTLELGTYDLELSYPLGSKTFTFNIKLNVTKYQPADPGKKDESCEKVIGPTWHWNNSKGICEDVGVVGTSTR